MSLLASSLVVLPYQPLTECVVLAAAALVVSSAQALQPRRWHYTSLAAAAGLPAALASPLPLTAGLLPFVPVQAKHSNSDGGYL